MAATGAGEGGRRAPPGSGSGSDRKEDWIAHHLRRVYDDAVHEVIPQKMLDALNALDDPDEDEKR